MIPVSRVFNAERGSSGVINVWRLPGSPHAGRAGEDLQADGLGIISSSDLIVGFWRLDQDDRLPIDIRTKRPQGDSNPCFQDENLMSWTWLDDGVPSQGEHNRFCRLGDKGR